MARDAALVGEALGGDPRARRTLAERLKVVPRLAAVINARRGQRLSAHDLEDLAQDTVLRIWEKLGTFTGHSTLEHWLYRFTFLEYMNRVRSKSRSASFEAPEAGHPARDPGALETAEREETADTLARGLEQLEEDQAVVIRLKHYEELSFPEIGVVLGISPNTVKSRYYRGIGRLHATLRSLDEEEA